MAVFWRGRIVKVQSHRGTDKLCNRRQFIPPLLIRPLSKPARVALLILLGAALSLTGGCEQRRKPVLDQIIERGKLRVVTRYGPITYYRNRGSDTGFEYELARRFAKKLGVELEISIAYSRDELLDALRKGKADIAAAGIIKDGQPAGIYFGPDYLSVRQFVVRRRGVNPADGPEDIVGKRVLVVAGSTQEKALNELLPAHPGLSWERANRLETLDLLEAVELGQVDYTVVNSNEYTAHRGVYPYLRVAFAVGEPQQLAWAIRDHPSNYGLRFQIDRFFDQLRESGRMASIIERYYGHREPKSQYQSQAFLNRMRSILPEYRELIEQIALEYEVDWRLIAAVAYQESHWDPKARSPTGVRGMMMLTRDTAREMGVTNRTDAEQSLRGGTRYLKKLLAKLPDEIPMPDRLWFALASYNMGYGHVLDLWNLARRENRNPYRWNEVKDLLPTLRQEKVYSTLRYGYARGDEALKYVQNIRYYHDLLAFTEINTVRVPPPKKAEDYIPERFNRQRMLSAF